MTLNKGHQRYLYRQQSAGGISGRQRRHAGTAGGRGAMRPGSRGCHRAAGSAAAALQAASAEPRQRTPGPASGSAACGTLSLTPVHCSRPRPQGAEPPAPSRAWLLLCRVWEGRIPVYQPAGGSQVGNCGGRPAVRAPQGTHAAQRAAQVPSPTPLARASPPPGTPLPCFLLSRGVVWDGARPAAGQPPGLPVPAAPLRTLHAHGGSHRHPPAVLVPHNPTKLPGRS